MIENPAPGRGAALAAQLTRATADLLAAAEACDVAQWQTLARTKNAPWACWSTTWPGITPRFANCWQWSSPAGRPHRSARQ